MPVSKFFTIAVEGATTDGRDIHRSWIEQMAKNFDPKKYGARVNLEHYLAMHPESTFRAYGDVVELKTEERDGKLHLLARVDATDDLVELHEKRQKIYSSIEIDPNFSDTGEAYLVGLAMTDSPASLGTEIMQFASQAKQNPFTARKQRSENLFTASTEAALDFAEEPETPAPAPESPSLLSKVKALFGAHAHQSATELAAFKGELEETLTEIVSEYKKGADQFAATFADISAKLTALTDDFNSLKEKLEEQPAPETFNRPAAVGGNAAKTDC